jgi:hypothetical protein
MPGYMEVVQKMATLECLLWQHLASIRGIWRDIFDRGTGWPPPNNLLLQQRSEVVEPLRVAQVYAYIFYFSKLFIIITYRLDVAGIEPFSPSSDIKDNRSPSESCENGINLLMKF